MSNLPLKIGTYQGFLWYDCMVDGRAVSRSNEPFSALERLAEAVLDGRVSIRATAVYERGTAVATDYVIEVVPPYIPISERPRQ